MSSDEGGAVVPVGFEDDWCPAVWHRIHRMILLQGHTLPICENCGQEDHLARLYWLTEGDPNDFEAQS